MGATPLSHFLLSLCQNSYWNYAVFWKVEHENLMLLTWEDGYYDHPKLIGPTERIPDYTCFNGSSKMLSSGWGSSEHDNHSGEYSIWQAVADLAGVQYQLGKGVVGEVAYTGNHGWVFCEDLFSCGFEGAPEFPYEWLAQFAAGIKTIVLIPVVPHGVLQLGTLEKVAEDLALVAYIKDKFNAHQIDTGLLPLTSMEISAQTSWLLMPAPLINSEELSTVTVNHMKCEDPKSVYGVESTNNKLPTNSQMMPGCLVQDPCHIFGGDSLDNINCTKEHDFCFQSEDLIQVSKPANLAVNSRESGMMEGGMVGFSTLQDELQTFSCSDNYNMGIIGEHAFVAMNSYVMEQTFENNNVDNRVHEIENTFSSIHMDCEVHKALEPSLLEQPKEYFWDSSLPNENACYSSSQILNRDTIHGVEPSTCESGGLFAKRKVAEHLWEAVVDNKNDTRFSMTSLGQFVASNEAQSQSQESAFVSEKVVPLSSKTTAFGARARNAFIESSPTSFESMMSTLIEEEEQKKGHGYMQTRKGSKLSNARKTRARPGEKKKPRPRDRQLIQDRVKELRELVPNGSKCSIDGLLDKVIRHMLFLRSVTDQTNKLRHSVLQEKTDQKNLKSSDAKCNRHSGTSWAFELGSDFNVCPIVVEDLEYPGQMLIEMLCNDHSLFLEIAEVICRFDLTILKGVMESRGNNTWARFVVEKQASMGFHRLDIFWPLMQLLQRAQSPISVKI